MSGKLKNRWREFTGAQKVALILVGFFMLFMVIGIAAGPAEDRPAEPQKVNYPKIAADGTMYNSHASDSAPPSDPAPPPPPAAQPAPKSKEPSVPAEYKSALSQATSYANTMHMSKKGVYDQLVSEYGGKFSAAAAQYGIDNVKADWNANALATAKSYQEQQHLSPAAIRDQLVSEYGEQFTAAEADYAIQHLDD
jgi:hypothetical protein